MNFSLIRLAGACSLVVLSCVSAAQAQSAPAATTPITLSEAIAKTLQANPGLQQFGYSLRTQDALIDTARLATPLEAHVELDNVLGTGETRGIDGAELTFALSRVIELGGKRERRVDVATRGRDDIAIEQQAAQLDALAEVSRRFIHVASDQQQLALTRQGVDLAQHTVAAVRRRVDAAKSPEVELHRADVERIRAHIALEHAEHELLASRVKLASLWGELEPTFAGVAADFDSLPRPDAFDVLIAKLHGNPDFTRFASTARLRDAEIRLAQSQRRADLTVSAGLRRLEAVDDQAFVIGFSIPFGGSQRAEPGIVAATARRDAVAAAQNDAFIQARAQLFELYQELQHAAAEAQTLSEQVVPQMQEALSETRYAYQRGRYSYLELAESQRAYIEVQRERIEAVANAHQLQVEIERLTGQPLATRHITPAESGSRAGP